MIDHVDNLLRSLLVNQIDEIASETQVRFQPPDEDWRKARSARLAARAELETTKRCVERAP